MRKSIQFHANAHADYIDWAKKNFEIFNKINALIFDIQRDHFKGLGKPEPLKFGLTGYWSRKITDEHRLVYRIEKDIIYIYSCHGHY